MSKVHPDVIRLVRYQSNIRCLSRVAAPKGFYTIPTEAGIGNRYVCYKPYANEGVEWVAGQIQHIIKQDGAVKMLIKRSVELQPTAQDPFAAFWNEGFQAKMVSSKLSSHLEIVNASRVIAHTARWELTSEIAVVLNLCAVCITRFVTHVAETAFFRIDHSVALTG